MAPGNDAGRLTMQFVACMSIVTNYIILHKEKKIPQPINFSTNQPFNPHLLGLLLLLMTICLFFYTVLYGGRQRIFLFSFQCPGADQ